MAGTSNALSKRERKRLRAERERAAERRRQQRRTIATTLGAAVVVTVAVVLFSNLVGPDSGAGPIQPSARADVSVSGPPRAELLGVGSQVPSFSAPGFRMSSDGANATIERNRVDWSSFRGTPTVLSIWASWCPHCQRELPVLSDAVAKMPGVKLVTVVTSIGAHPGPTPSQYLGDEGLTFPVAIDDAQGTLAHALGVRAFPTLYFVGTDGRVTYSSEGEVPDAVLQQQLAKLS
jgi:thiol-disulfide isomerase/thioredoxin